jgi:hypothetical protein
VGRLRLDAHVGRRLARGRSLTSARFPFEVQHELELVREEIPSPRDRDRLETGARIECPQHGADVVSSRLDAYVKLLRDPLGREAMIKKAQHLGLPWGQVLRWRRRLFLIEVLDLPEDADDSVAAVKRDGTKFDRQALAVCAEDHALVVRARRWPEQIPGEDRPRPLGFLGRDNRGVVAAANVSNELLRCRIEPADDPLRVDHVGRHPNALDGVLDIDAKVLELGHAFEFAPHVAELQIFGGEPELRRSSSEKTCEKAFARAGLQSDLLALRSGHPSHSPQSDSRSCDVLPPHAPGPVSGPGLTPLGRLHAHTGEKIEAALRPPGPGAASSRSLIRKGAGERDGQVTLKPFPTPLLVGREPGRDFPFRTGLNSGAPLRPGSPLQAWRSAQ